MVQNTIQWCKIRIFVLHHNGNTNTIFRRTTKSEGIIKLRFRLRDGRDVDLYHKSEIKADLKT